MLHLTSCTGLLILQTHLGLHLHCISPRHLFSMGCALWGEAVVVSRFIELIYRDIHKELSATYSIFGAEFLSWIANYPSDIDVK